MGITNPLTPDVYTVEGLVSTLVKHFDGVRS
jgi:hypothetical protein